MSRNCFTRYTLWLIIVGAAMAAPACQEQKSATTESSTGPATSADAAMPVDSHGLHVVNNARLRDIMHRLNEIEFDRMSREIEYTGQVREDLSMVAELAASLAKDARVIPLIFKDEEMTDESRRVMGTMAERLRTEAQALGDAAGARDVDRVKDQLDLMIKTCNACHASFRAPAVATGRSGGTSRIAPAG